MFMSISGSGNALGDARKSASPFDRPHRVKVKKVQTHQKLVFMSP
jgi:hypothetical protein